jgi:hypothetical protein
MPFAGLTAAALLKNTPQLWFKKEEKVVLLTVRLFWKLWASVWNRKLIIPFFGRPQEVFGSCGF